MITPGEWTFGNRSDGSKWLSLGDPKIGPHFQGNLLASDDDARLIVAAPDAIEACLVVKRYLLSLEFGLDIADPLRKFRERIHAPMHAALDKALDKAFARTEPTSTVTEAEKSAKTKEAENDSPSSSN